MSEPDLQAEGGVRGLLAGLSDVVEQHLALARYELSRDLRTARTRLVALVAGALLLCCGLLLAQVATALWLGRVLGDPAMGFGIVGAVDLAIGGAIALIAWRRLMQADFLVAWAT